MRIVKIVAIGFLGILLINTIVTTMYYNWIDPEMSRLQEKFSLEGSGEGGTSKECLDFDGRGCDGVSQIIIGASNLVARDRYCKEQRILRFGGWYNGDHWPFAHNDTFSIYFKTW